MSLLTDLRFALRLLRKNLTSSIMAVFVVAVGTSVAITMFAFVNGILWSPLDLNEDREILLLEWAVPDKLRDNRNIHPLDYEILTSESQSFEKFTCMRWDNRTFYNPSGRSVAKRYELAFVEPNFFDFAKSTPILGRTFRPEDAIGIDDDTLIISHSLWLEHFGGDESVLTSTAILDGKPCQIVGVMPKGYFFPDEVNIWVASDWAEAKQMDRRSWHRVHMLGVLKDGVSKTTAASEIAAIAQTLEQQFPETNEGLNAVSLPPYSIWLTKAVVSERFDNTCYALLFCSVLVLGVASSNLFNLIMSRTATRTNELSIRNAMGASRRHIIGQVVFDGLILTSIGAVIGTLISYWSLKLIWSIFKQQTYVPYWWNLEMDATVIAFVITIIFLSSTAATLLPGFRASRSSVASNLKDDARTSTGLFLGGLTKFVLSFQIFAAGALVFVSVVMMIFWIHMKNWETPYDPDRILDGALQLTSLDKQEDGKAILRFTQDFKTRLERYPNPATIAFASEEAGGAVRGPNWMNMIRFEMDGQAYDEKELRPEARRVVISEGFEQVFNLKVIRGRSLNSLDTSETDLVCVINENLASHYWKEENPIGKRIRFFDPTTPEVTQYRTIVGVISNVSAKPMPGQNLIKDGFAHIYVPIDQAVWINQLHVLIRASGDPFKWTVPLQTELRSMNPELAFHGRFMTIQGIIDRNNVSKDLVFTMFGVFGISSLILGIGGMYAVVSFTTRQRFREFAIRMAIGASPKDVMTNVLKHGLRGRLFAASIGIGIGHYVALSLKTMIGVPYLPIGLAYPIALFIILSSIALSMGLPAWRASKLSPLQAMRTH